MVRSFENHGFSRRQDVSVDGVRWEIVGDHGRATITFSDDHRPQTHVWKWRPEETWLPLCDRTATRTDGPIHHLASAVDRAAQAR